LAGQNDHDHFDRERMLVSNAFEAQSNALEPLSSAFEVHLTAVEVSFVFTNKM
jgi:hypothetical protein